MNNNGLLSFGDAVSTYTPRSFPLNDDQLIAPYWADVDTRGKGTVWFREVNDSTLLDRIGRDIHANVDNLFGFQPTLALIVTWDSVGYYSSHYDLVSTCMSDYCSLLASPVYHPTALNTEKCAIVKTWEELDEAIQLTYLDKSRFEVQKMLAKVKTACIQ